MSKQDMIEIEGTVVEAPAQRDFHSRAGKRPPDIGSYLR